MESNMDCLTVIKYKETIIYSDQLSTNIDEVLM